MSIIHEALKKAQVHLDKKEDELKKDGKENHSKENDSKESFTPDVSRIYEQLHAKKTTLEIPTPPGPLKQPLGSSTFSQDQKSLSKKRKRWIPFLLLLMIGLLIGFSSWLAGSHFLKVKIAHEAKQPPQPKFYSLNALPRVKQTTAPTDALIIQGTMMTGNKTVALINDGIYEEGDLINGKKILTITLEKVIVEDQEGNISTLSVSASH